MKSALNRLETEFDALLDNWCIAVENGKLFEAEEAAIQAEDFIEAIDLLKMSRHLGNGVEMGT